MKKVLWLTNIPSPYRVSFFNELGRDCELTVLFEKAFSEERDDRWKEYECQNFTGIVLPSKSVDVDKAISFSAFRYLWKYRREIIVISNPASPTGILAISFLRVLGIPYVIESDGAFPKKSTGLKGLLKRFLYVRSKACFTTSELGKEYFLLNGVPHQNIYKYPFTSIHDSDIPDAIGTEQKDLLRKQLHIEEPRVVISVGRFIKSKGFDVLLEAVSRINDKTIGFYIVGDKPTKEFLGYCNEKKLSNVHFVDFMPPTKLREWYLAADVFTLPTRTDVWGLVINEAMSCGLPVVTTNMCIAGTEMVSEDNGILIDIDDSKALADGLLSVLNNVDKEAMSKNARDVASAYTIEKMAQKHIQLFKEIYE